MSLVYHLMLTVPHTLSLLLLLLHHKMLQPMLLPLVTCKIYSHQTLRLNPLSLNPIQLLKPQSLWLLLHNPLSPCGFSFISYWNYLEVVDWFYLQFLLSSLDQLLWYLAPVLVYSLQILTIFFYPLAHSHTMLFVYSSSLLSKLYDPKVLSCTSYIYL